MEGSKLIRCLKSLSPKQMKRYRDLVHSPYFNKQADVRKLIDALALLHPKFPQRKTDKKKVFEDTFPGEPYDEKKMGYLMSDLVRLFDAFLAHNVLEEDRGNRYFFTVKKLNELELEKEYKRVMRDARSWLRKSSERDSMYFFNEFLLDSIDNVHFDRQRKHAFDDSLQRAIDHLDIYYISTKLKYSCEMANRKNVVTGDYELRLLDEILLYLHQHPSEDIPAIRIYYQILLTLTDKENEAHFKKLKALLIEHSASFPKQEARDMYAYAQNYCIQRANKGDSTYLNELFDLYKTSLDREILFDGKYLSPFAFKNIVAVALRIKKYDWTAEFIETYAQRIRSKFRENAYLYNKASLHFERKEYNQALGLLNQVEFTDVVYNLGAKAMILRIYYDLEEVDALYSLIDAFKVYLRRNKLISDYQKTLHLNLLKFVKRARSIPKGDRVKIENLNKAIDQTRQIAYSNWLREKVDELA